MSEIRILVVEDERIVSLDIQARLRSLGYDVVGSATSGEEAVRKADLLRPDLVLMDIMLDGEMDGIQAAEVVRAQYGLPVIFLTAYADPATLARAKVTEPFAYILKPFEERELHGHIEIALYRHRMEQRLRESEERYVLATEGANDGIWDWDLRHQRIYFSPRWKSMLGYCEDEIEDDPKEWFGRLHSGDKASVKEKLGRHIDGESPHFESEYRIRCKDGSYRWMLSRGMVLRTPSGKAHRIAGSQTDITERKVYDPITALPNRTLFVDRVQTAIERSQRDGNRSFAVLSLNLNDLGVEVDGLGANRDEVLTRIAERFQSAVRQGDTVARLEEDSFGIVLTEISGSGEAAEAAARFQKVLGRPLEVNGQDFYVRASIGVALGSTGYASAEDAIRDATTAMHRARISESPTFEIFDEEMRVRVADRIRWEADLRRALEKEDLTRNEEFHGSPSLAPSPATVVIDSRRWMRARLSAL
jgi:PAS domain S-box-containing protein/diguanylate cyclase (GGDEF)-like protein